MRRGLPAGVPLGRALDIPAGIAYDDLREVVAAIDRVHGDGELPRIPVRLVTGIERRGSFQFDEETGAPVSIVVRANQDHGQFALLHEIGHFLDLHAFGSGGEFGTSSNSVLLPWSEAALASRAHQTLAGYARTGFGEIISHDDSRMFKPLPPAAAAALPTWITLEETWARSYAQYVTACSGLPDLIRSLDVLRRRPIETVYYPLQWDDGDFAPIAKTIDELMRVMGWRR